MWTRAELKTKAKANLKNYYWAAFGISLITSIAGGSNQGSGSTAGMNVAQDYNGINTGGSGDSLGNTIMEIPNIVNETIHSINLTTWGILAISLCIALVISLVIGIFITPVVKVGKNRFYMESRELGKSAGIKALVWGFKHNYLNIVWTMFLKSAIVSLGAICCIFPGIYFSYSYQMVPYILAENPDMKARDVLKVSEDMMDGQRLSSWILDLSFIGWWIASSFLCGMGSLFVLPYYEATHAELYAVLRQRFTYCLNGFGHGQFYNDSSENYYHYTQNPYDQNPYTENPYTQNPQDSYYEMPTDMPNPEKRSQREERESEVRRSEGGPGRGYYLNGEFHPYTEDELNELDQNR